MNLKGLIQDMRDGIGSISRRRSNSNGNTNSNNGSSSFDLKLPYRNRSRSLSAVLDESQFGVVRQNSLSSSSAAAALVPASRRCCWASMPPELLRDIISRVESSETSWPPRRALVACAGVCRTWRQTTKELVSTVEDSGKLTFPISLKQPGPRDLAIQCFIKRNRTTSTYRLYLGLTPTLGDPGKFLLAARKVRRPTGNDYIISLDADDMSRGSNTYVGKLRSNFLGTKFTIYDSQPPPQSNATASSSMGRAGRRVGSKGSFSIANIAYELNVLGTRGPRRMQCAMHSIPASAMEPGGPAPPTPLEFPGGGLSSASSASNKSSTTSTIPEFFGNAGEEEDNNGGGVGTFAFNDGALVLKNKAPRWHEQLQCWCLNFQGRVTVASVKNFQLVAAPPPEPASPTTTTTTTAATTTTNTTTAATTTTTIGIGGDYEKVLLQFGKVSTDVFTMDYRYPLSASQAFAICLSSFDTKLACE